MSKSGNLANKRKKNTKKSRAKRKIRPPEHMRADMSFHHVAYIIVKAGFTVDETKKDYGYDAYIEFFDSSMQAETGYVFIQLKATEDIKSFKKTKGFSYSVDMRDFDLWAENPFPVYFILFDATTESAYWMYFQKYVQANKLDASKIISDSITVYIDPNSRINSSTPMVWQQDKNNVLMQIPKVIHV